MNPILNINNSTKYKDLMQKTSPHFNNSPTALENYRFVEILEMT